MANIRLVFDKPTEEQLGHIRNAEVELTKAGVTFDLGNDFADDGSVISRDWELDWSLKGARVVEALGGKK